MPEISSSSSSEHGWNVGFHPEACEIQLFQRGESLKNIVFMQPNCVHLGVLLGANKQSSVTDCCVGGNDEAASFSSSCVCCWCRRPSALCISSCPAADALLPADLPDHVSLLFVFSWVTQSTDTEAKCGHLFYKKNKNLWVSSTFNLAGFMKLELKKKSYGYKNIYLEVRSYSGNSVCCVVWVQWTVKLNLQANNRILVSV